MLETAVLQSREPAFVPSRARRPAKIGQNPLRVPAITQAIFAITRTGS
jgi:hypothetical protein